VSLREIDLVLDDIWNEMPLATSPKIEDYAGARAIILADRHAVLEAMREEIEAADTYEGMIHRNVLLAMLGRILEEKP